MIYKILFFDDRDVVRGMQEKFPNFVDKFPSWATESNAMHQYAIWVALQLEGLGCNLQHYNPLINAKVQSTWGLQDSWELKAQMVLGTATVSAKTKMFLLVEDRFKTFGAGHEGT